MQNNFTPFGVKPLNTVQNLNWEEEAQRNNSPILPNSIRGLIVGKSGCGKTNLLLNFLLNPELLDYNKLLVYGKSLFQPKYKILKYGFDNNLDKQCIYNLFNNRKEIKDPYKLIKEIGETYSNKNPIKCEFFENGEDIKDPKELITTDKNLMIFDDVLLEKQNKCNDFYTRGRHSNVDCFYLSQNYFRLPRQTIRENSNFICLFKQDNKNINHIYQDHVSHDMSYDEFKKLCNICWEKPYDFLVIDNSSNPNNGKYRYNLDTFYFPKND